MKMRKNLFKYGIFLIFGSILLVSCAKEQKTGSSTEVQESSRERIVKPKLAPPKVSKPEGPVEVQPGPDGTPGSFTFTRGDKSINIFIPFGYEPQIQTTRLQDVDGNGISELWVTISYTDPVINRKFLIYKDAFSVEGEPKLVLGLDFQRKSRFSNDFRADYSASAKAFIVSGMLSGDDGKRMVMYQWNEEKERFVPDKPSKYSRLAVEEVGHDGISDFYYQMVDRLGNPFPMESFGIDPNDLDHFASISNDKMYLVVHDNGKISMVNLDTGEKNVVSSMPENLEGYSSALWAPGNRKVAFVGVNQGEYPEGARVFQFEIGKQGLNEFDVPVHFECGGICTSEPGKDFWWDTPNRIRYRIHELKEDRKAPSDVIELTAQ